MPQSDPRLATLELLAAACRLNRIPRDGGDILVLKALDQAGRRGMTQVSLGNALDLFPATLSRLIDSMEGRGLVMRKPHPLDRRSKVVEITDVGRQRIAAQSDHAMTESDRLFVDFSNDDLTSLRTLLSRLVSNSGRTQRRLATCKDADFRYGP